MSWQIGQYIFPPLVLYLRGLSTTVLRRLHMYSPSGARAYKNNNAGVWRGLRALLLLQGVHGVELVEMPAVGVVGRALLQKNMASPYIE